MKKSLFFLLKQLAITDFKLQYSGTVLGYLWSLLNPLALFAVFYIVLSFFVRFNEISHYKLYLLLGILLWGYFATATTRGMTAIQNHAGLIARVNFPKTIIILASNLNALIVLGCSLFIFALFMIWEQIIPKPTLWLFPFIVIQLILLSLAVSFLLSAFYLRFKDLAHLWAIILRVGFWTTPIVYPLTRLPEKGQFWMLLNPMTRIITHARDTVIYGITPKFNEVLFTFIIVSLLCWIGFHVFRYRSKKFVEEL